MLSGVAAFFECFCDSDGKLFTDLLELLGGAILELGEVSGCSLQQESSFGESIGEYQAAGEFESASGIRGIVFHQTENAKEVLAGDRIQLDGVFPVVCGAGDDGVEFVDCGDGSGHIA